MSTQLTLPTFRVGKEELSNGCGDVYIFFGLRHNNARMIDAKLILEQPDLVEANNKKRGKEIDLSVAADLLRERSKQIEEVENMRAMANEVASRISKANPDEREKLIKKGTTIKTEVKKLEGQLQGIQKRLDVELHKYPNILQEAVKDGKDESENELIREVGIPTQFTFQPKDHEELATALGILDVERAAKVSGSRFVYLKGDLVLLEFALVQYALSVIVPEGFTPILPPHIVSTKAMAAMGYLDHGGEKEIYHLKNDDAVLIGTSEQAIGPMHMDEILDEKELPLRYIGFSPCYRREAGTYGKDTKGMFRVHQFDKVEMFSFTRPEHSNKEHEKLLALQERLMQGLGLPYRVMRLCSGDTGSSSSMTYDIETWLPSEQRYRETSSTSNTTDFQTRRLNIRYKKDKSGSGTKTEFVHALNGTAFSGRPMIMIMENFQRKDGSIAIPDVLRPWMGKSLIKPKK